LREIEVTEFLEAQKKRASGNSLNSKHAVTGIWQTVPIISRPAT
jgi:hypothetical protein